MSPFARVNFFVENSLYCAIGLLRSEFHSDSDGHAQIFASLSQSPMRVTGSEFALRSIATHMSDIVKHYRSHLNDASVVLHRADTHTIEIDLVQTKSTSLRVVAGDDIAFLDIAPFKYRAFLPVYPRRAIQSLCETLGPSFHASDTSDWGYNLLYSDEAYLAFRDEETLMAARLILG